MSFYVEITERSLKFGGLKSIPVDWGFISQSSTRLFTEPDGNICSPIGIWVTGTSVQTNFVSSVLRLTNNLSEEKLIELTNQHDVRIFIATTKRFYIYRSAARLFEDYVDGCYSFSIGCTPSVIENIKKGMPIPCHWSVDSTDYF